MPLFYSPTAILTPYLQAFLLVTIAATDNVLSAINFPLTTSLAKSVGAGSILPSAALLC